MPSPFVLRVNIPMSQRADARRTLFLIHIHSLEQWIEGLDIKVLGNEIREDREARTDTWVRDQLDDQVRLIGKNDWDRNDPENSEAASTLTSDQLFMYGRWADDEVFDMNVVLERVRTQMILEGRLEHRGVPYAKGENAHRFRPLARQDYWERLGHANAIEFLNTLQGGDVTGSLDGWKYIHSVLLRGLCLADTRRLPAFSPSQSAFALEIAHIPGREFSGDVHDIDQMHQAELLAFLLGLDDRNWEDMIMITNKAEKTLDATGRYDEVVAIKWRLR